MPKLALKQHLFLAMGSIFHDTRQYLDQQFKAYDLTRNEWLILALLRVHGGQIAQTEAKSHLGIETSYFTKVLNNLEQKHYILREIDQNDRRGHILKLNPASAQKIKALFKVIHNLTAAIQSDLSDQQVQNLHGMLGQINQRLSIYKKQKKERIT